MLSPWKKSYDQPRQCIKKLRYYFANKGPSSQGYDFSSGHVWMWELDYKESWVQKNWCFWTVVWRRLLRVPWTARDQPLHPKGAQSWIFIGRTDPEAEAQILGPPDVKNWLIGKDPDAGKDWRQKEKGTDRGWDGWIVSLTQWTWVWANSGRWWRTGKPGMLQSMGLQSWTRLSDWTNNTGSWLLALPFSVKARWPCLSHVTSWFLMFHIYNIVIPLHKDCCNN